MQDEQSWHTVVAFGKLAEHRAQQLAEGSQVLVRGRLQVRSYQGRDGAQRTAVEVVADELEPQGAPAVAGGADEDD
jgi:single-strand DNA-binding protein